MQLVEQTIIKQNDPRYTKIDAASFASKNLYNFANYLMRQSFIHQGKRLGYGEVFHLIKKHEVYCALPRKVSNSILILLDKNWQSFFKAMEAWHIDPSKFLGRPKLPGYKDKTKGRNILIYDLQAISRKGLKKGFVTPSQLGIEIPTKQTKIKQVRIIPCSGFYVVETVYEKEVEQKVVDLSLYAGIDIGLNNLATVTSNKSGFMPRIVNGRSIKSINQWYNKERARLQTELAKEKRFTSRHLERLTNKRTRKIEHYLHGASKKIIDLLIQEKIGHLVIGKNDHWKQKINLGKKNNQNFVSIPHARFIAMLTYKAKLVGIEVHITEESYTSKCSFLDNEPIGKHEHYLGKRISRGLFRSQFGTLINADVNGSLNIIKKVASDAFVQGSRGCAVHPLPLAIGA
jgi:putative transposase